MNLANLWLIKRVALLIIFHYPPTIASPDTDSTLNDIQQLDQLLSSHTQFDSVLFPPLRPENYSYSLDKFRQLIRDAPQLVQLSYRIGTAIHNAIKNDRTPDPVIFEHFGKLIKKYYDQLEKIFKRKELDDDETGVERWRYIGTAGTVWNEYTLGIYLHLFGIKHDYQILMKTKSNSPVNRFKQYCRSKDASPFVLLKYLNWKLHDNCVQSPPGDFYQGQKAAAQIFHSLRSKIHKCTVNSDELYQLRDAEADLALQFKAFASDLPELVQQIQTKINESEPFKTIDAALEFLQLTCKTMFYGRSDPEQRACMLDLVVDSVHLQWKPMMWFVRLIHNDLLDLLMYNGLCVGHSTTNDLEYLTSFMQYDEEFKKRIMAERRAKITEINLHNASAQTPDFQNLLYTHFPNISTNLPLHNSYLLNSTLMVQQIVFHMSNYFEQALQFYWNCCPSPVERMVRTRFSRPMHLTRQYNESAKNLKEALDLYGDVNTRHEVLAVERHNHIRHTVIHCPAEVCMQFKLPHFYVVVARFRKQLLVEDMYMDLLNSWVDRYQPQILQTIHENFNTNNLSFLVEQIEQRIGPRFENSKFHAIGILQSWNFLEHARLYAAMASDQTNFHNTTREILYDNRNSWTFYCAEKFLLYFMM